ncbi:hypothetical protein ABT063_01535 [Streptomyces sp. NPDC002838]|uniref:hypothetical protein n=1 Tax=Streptomyces sp. NPDC002838 TaxID=3154436 RepID=UPI00331FB417
MKRDSLELRRFRLRRGAAAVALVALGAGGGWAAVPAAAAGSAVAGSVCEPTAGFTGCRQFDATGAKENFQVPTGVTSLDVRAWGGGGHGTALAFGGAGGYTAGTLKVAPGETLSVAVASLRNFGDALGGAGGGHSGGRGGASSAIRTSGGEALIIAGGGGGGAYDDSSSKAYGGAAGGEKGQDGFEAAGGKGADKGTGGAGGGNGAAGADQSAGGRGGAGGADGGGGGGAGYAGGGGGAGVADRFGDGSGGGGSSYADPDRVTDVRLLGGDKTTPAAKDDPFWSPHSDPVTMGIGEGGITTTPGGDGRVVIQWKGAVAPAELSAASAVEQSVELGGEVQPFAAVVRDKDGNPVPGVSVKFAIVDPAKLGLYFGDFEADKSVVVETDAQGRAQTPPIYTSSSQKGDFTVRATAPGGLSTDFTVHLKNLANEVTAVAGDKQQAEPGQPFAEALQAVVTDSGKPAVGAKVDFRVEGSGSGGPEFEGKFVGVQETADAEGKVTAPELVAGEELGTYTVTATVGGGASVAFTVEVVAEDETDPSASPTPSPTGSADNGTGGTGDDNGSGTGGTGNDNSAQLTDGGLASTGAGGIGLMLGAAAALAALGVAAVRFAPRLRVRFQNRR